AIAADVTGDGLLDLFISNFGRKVLYANRGDGTFEDATDRFGLTAIRRLDSQCPETATDRQCLLVSWGAEFQDFDLDSYPDLVVVNGHVNGTDRRQPLAAWKGGPGGAFTPVQTSLGWLAGRGAVSADLDGDGDLDLLL